MNTRTRSTLTIAAACVAVAAFTGCTSASPDGPATSTTTAWPASPTATPTRVAPTQTAPTETAVADPTAVQPPAAPTTAPPAAAPEVSPLAQHIYDECSKGAADAGVTLQLTANPSGYDSDDHYQLVYPFTFNDGHDDPYAVYNCALTDKTVNSTFIGGGMTDSH
jgi:hypothetical protein